MVQCPWGRFLSLAKVRRSEGAFPVGLDEVCTGYGDDFL